MATNQPFNLTTQIQTSNTVRAKDGITTYGALLLPFEITKEKVIQNVKAKTSLMGKLRTGWYYAQAGIQTTIEHPIQTFKDLAKYMTDNREKISGVMTTIGSKFSGIAVTQAIINGNVSTREALDYLFMGFAPALGVTGSLFGYSGLVQLKDVLFNGSIDVGSFVNSFSRILKGATDLSDLITNKKNRKSKNVIEFDLTISHNETYQSETPDRRVQSGQSLNEFVHNMPETIDVQCALQDGRRYSKAEFRAILKYLRDRKETVQLVLGDELFDSLILTNFNPSHDCSKSGMDYSLSFKKVYRNDIDTKTEVTIQKVPIKLEDTDSFSSLSSSKLNTGSLKKQIEGLQKSITPKDLPPIKSGGIVDGVNGTLIKSNPTVYRSTIHRISPNALYNDGNYPPNMRIDR